MSHSHHNDEQPSHEVLNEHRIDLAYRDQCANLLIPLNVCRKENASLPFRCTDERHAYEKCQYLEYKKRVELLKEEKKKA